MKRTALLFLLLAAAPRLDAQGAESPNAAIEQFLTAAQKKDLPAMASVWGTVNGPASKAMSKKELERREFIMITCLAHEKATIGESSPGEAGRLRIPVELRMLALTASPTFTLVRGPKKRWFVENVDMEHLRDRGFCGATSAPGAPKPTPPR